MAEWLLELVLYKGRLEFYSLPVFAVGLLAPMCVSHVERLGNPVYE